MSRLLLWQYNTSVSISHNFVQESSWMNKIYLSIDISLVNQQYWKLIKITKLFYLLQPKYFYKTALGKHTKILLSVLLRQKKHKSITECIVICLLCTCMAFFAVFFIPNSLSTLTIGPTAKVNKHTLLSLRHPGVY